MWFYGVCSFSNAGKQFYMIIYGDFNVEVNKLNKCASLGCLRLFLERHSLQNVSMGYSDALKHTFSCPARNFSSWLDHIFACSNLLSSCSEHVFSIIDSSINNSDHLSVHFGFCFKNSITCQPVEPGDAPQTYSKYIWTPEAKCLYCGSTGYAIQNLLCLFIAS